MQLLPSLRAGAIALTFAVCAANAALAQDATTIIKKANAVYSNAKTYQATFQMDMSMGKLGSVSQVIDLKMIPNQKAAVVSKPNGKATGQMAMAAGQMNTQMYDDGKTMYTYMQGVNKYMKRPHVAGKNGNGMTMLLPQLGDPTATKASYKLLPPATVNGKPAYAIEIGNKSGPQSGALTVFIDRASYHVLQVKMNGAATPQANAMNMSMNMVIKNEKFNQPIPASAFVFTPPAGATEMTGFGGMMGGAPQGR